MGQVVQLIGLSLPAQVEDQLIFETLLKIAPNVIDMALTSLK